MLRAAALVLVAVFLVIGLAACGDDDDVDETPTEQTTTTTEEETTTTAGAADGQEIFTDNCGTCHTLAAAGTAGAVGPDLDESSLDAPAVEAQIRDGGGGMPAFGDQLSDEEISAVATFVVDARG